MALKQIEILIKRTKQREDKMFPAICGEKSPVRMAEGAEMDGYSLMKS